MMSSKISKKSLNIQVQLLFAQFFQNNQLSAHYSLSLSHNLTQFQTTLYTIHDNKMDFITLKPFFIQYQPENQNYKNLSTPLLKITFSPVTPQSKLQSIIDQRSVIPFSKLINPKQKKGKKSNKCFLVFPIMQRGRIVVGEINIRFTFTQIDQSTQLISSRALGSTISKNSMLKQRKKVFSNSGKIYFNPCVSSKPITATARQQQCEEQQKKLISFRNSSNLHNNLQFQKNSQVYNNHLQSEQIPLPQQKFDQKCQSKLQKVSDKNQSIEISCDVQVPLANHKPKAFSQQQPSQNFEEIPQDYRHLFQKICEINKKYAPLQRIPSQQQLSEQTILVQKKSSNQSFYSLNSDVSQTKSNPLAVAQELLKQLNLYKFGQSLLPQNQRQKVE